MERSTPGLWQLKHWKPFPISYGEWFVKSSDIKWIIFARIFCVGEGPHDASLVNITLCEMIRSKADSRPLRCLAQIPQLESRSLCLTPALQERPPRGLAERQNKTNPIHSQQIGDALLATSNLLLLQMWQRSATPPVDRSWWASSACNSCIPRSSSLRAMPNFDWRLSCPSPQPYAFSRLKR